MKNRQARILILKGENLAQFVEAEPSFAAIRSAHPDALVDLLTTNDLGRLAKGAPYFDRVLAAGEFTDSAAKKRFFTQLKKIGYSCVYDLDGSRRSMDIKKALNTFRGLKWIGPKRTVSQKGGTLFPSFAAPAMRKMLHDDAEINVEGRLPDLTWSLEGRKDAANMQPSWYGITAPFALLVPARDPKSRWAAEAYVDFANDVIGRGYTPVLVGGADLKEFGDQVSQLMIQAGARIGGGAGARALVDLIDKTDLAQLAALARQSSFFVSGLTEEIHLLSGVGCPGVLMMHPRDNAGTDALHGRNVVRLTAENMANIDPQTATNTLVSMGLLTEQKAADENPPILRFEQSGL